jgi:hypothetical protein
VIGLAFDLFGGSESTSRWTAAFPVMAIGSSAAALAMRSLQRVNREKASTRAVATRPE